MPSTTIGPSRPIWDILASASYRFLGSAGIMVNVGVWSWVLASSYLVYQLTESPFLTQLNGVAFAGPDALDRLGDLPAAARQGVELVLYLDAGGLIPARGSHDGGVLAKVRAARRVHDGRPVLGRFFGVAGCVVGV